ncbi:hypothetical protein EIP86_001632 [Pleurotus ostreatoroseus]|nr:hypothetical protein EIP86_001632 [Pleurotus ostreatoroseus]
MSQTVYPDDGDYAHDDMVPMSPAEENAAVAATVASTTATQLGTETGLQQHLATSANAAADPNSASDLTPPSWWNLVRHSPVLAVPCHWLDGLVGCATADGKYLLTSPTNTFIPCPIFGLVDIQLLPDGHFGAADPIHHPQLIQHNSRYPWMSAILRKDSDFRQRHRLWEPLDRTTSFELVKTSNVGLGVVPRAFKQFANDLLRPLSVVVSTFDQVYTANAELRWLFNTLVDAVDRLAFPATFRDLARTWACVQRFWLYNHAWINWNVHFMQTYPLPLEELGYPPMPFDEWTGCVTTSVTLASRLAKANIPVWLMRPINNLSGDEIVARAVSFTEPVTSLRFANSNQLAENEHLFGQKLSSHQVAGDDHLSSINRMAMRTLDEERSPMPFAVSASSDSIQHPPAASVSAAENVNGLRSHRFAPYVSDITISTRARNAGKNERLKFAEFSHPFLPPAIPQWQLACSKVDLSAPAVDGTAVWRYLFPEARLVFTSPTARRQIRFICNWIRLREVWLFLVTSPSYDSKTVHPLRNQEWREYLYTSAATQSTSNPLTSNIAMKKHEKTAKHAIERKRSVHDMFRLIFGQNVMDCPIPDAWFERSLNTLHTADQFIDDTETAYTFQLMAWELHELGFRWELMELDKFLVLVDADEPIEDAGRQALLDAPTKMLLREHPMLKRCEMFSAGGLQLLTR